MKIAIVGAGIAGLTAASVLSRKHAITVFEAGNHIGGHTNTIPIREGNQTLAVDTGFIVFNEPNYPNLLRLFDQHDVPIQDSDMSFSVHEPNTGFEYNGVSFDALFAQRANLLKPRFWGMLASIMRFHREAPLHLSAGMDDSLTVSQYVKRHHYSSQFVEHYLVPLGASLWSCDAVRFQDFPMTFVLEFLDNHHMLQLSDRPMWKTVRGGSYQYVRRLVSQFRRRIFLGCAVSTVRRRAGYVEVGLADGRNDSFDEVILASHADQSMRMLDCAEDDETDLLAAFPYQKNEVVLHTDTNLLPRRRKAWASWNYRIAEPRQEQEQEQVTVTYNMNKLQMLDSSSTYCVSLNQADAVSPAHVIRKIKYEHPVFKPGRSAAQREHGQLIRRRRVSHCGAYWGYGFHEDGVRSALAVCESFGMDLDS